MTLADTLQHLLRLQRLNDEAARHRRDKEALFKDVELQRAEVDRLAARTEEIKAQRQQAQKEADSLEVKIEAAEEESEKMRIQLNTTKHQSEYDTIRNSILSRQADVSRFEDQELQLLERVEGLEGEARNNAELLDAAREELEDIQQRVAGEAQQYDQSIADLEDERRRLREGIDKEVLTTYDRLFASRGTSVVVMVKDRVCLGCHTTLPKQTENELMRGAEIIFCHNCGRILMLADESESAGE